MTTLAPGDRVRRSTWPEGMFTVVREVGELGVRGQWHVQGRPSGSPSAFFSYRPCGVSMPFQVLSAPAVAEDVEDQRDDR